MIITGINRTELKKRYARIYERRTLDEQERARTQRAANGIRAKIVDFFREFPNARISPSEFKELMQLPNAIHSIRPRFTDLETENWLQAIPTDKVRTEFNGEERRYKRMESGEQLSLL